MFQYFAFRQQIQSNTMRNWISTVKFLLFHSSHHIIKIVVVSNSTDQSSYKTLIFFALSRSKGIFYGVPVTCIDLSSFFLVWSLPIGISPVINLSSCHYLAEVSFSLVFLFIVFKEQMKFLPWVERWQYFVRFFIKKRNIYSHLFSIHF